MTREKEKEPDQDADLSSKKLKRLNFLGYLLRILNQIQDLLGTLKEQEPAGNPNQPIDFDFEKCQLLDREKKLRLVFIKLEVKE